MEDLINEEVAMFIQEVKKKSVDQAGSERTEAGESALPAEESPHIYICSYINVNVF